MLHIFKKTLAVGAISMLSCTMAFAKHGALDLAEKSLSAEGLTNYSCKGDDNYAVCNIDMNLALIDMKGASLEVAVKDRVVNTKVMWGIGDDLRLFSDDMAKFIPSSFSCQSQYNLNETARVLDSLGECEIKANVATFNIKTKTNVASNKAFRYKETPSAIYTMLGDIQSYSRMIDDYRNNRMKEISELRQKEMENQQRLYIERDMLKREWQIAQHDKCGKYDLEEISDRIFQNEKVSSYGLSHLAEEEQKLAKKWDKKKQVIIDSIVESLSKYDVEVSQMKLHLRTNKLSEALFTALTRSYIPENIDELYVLAEDDEEKERLDSMRSEGYSSYYAKLEATKSSLLSDIAANDMLSDNLKKSLAKIVRQHVKVYDPHSHVRSTKVLVTPLEKTTYNLGTEAKIFIQSMLDNDGDKFVDHLYDIVNKYDVRLVKSW